MQDFIVVMGMILKAEPVGDYDRRLVILTKEKGKITAFAKGARKPNSRFVAATSPFSFGEFKLYVGREAYNVLETNISNYFDELRSDFMGAYYGMYFCEVINYYTRENADELDMLKLLYQSMRALSNEHIGNDLIRYIFEIKALAINGEYPGVPENKKILESTEYTLSYIVNSQIEKLYSFTVSDEVFAEVKQIAGLFRNRFVDQKFKSMEIIDSMTE